MKKTNITCPYCGAPAVYRPAGAVYKNNTKQKGSHLYVCSRWPVCDSYVAAHRHNSEPKLAAEMSFWKNVPWIYV